MSKSVPIACTLNAEERPRRGTELRSLGRDGLLSIERGEQRVVLRFRPEAAIRERVEAIAAAESKCCAFLSFDVADAGDATALTVIAPDGGEAMMHELASLIAQDAAASS
jgi:hypothetical protein